jgi:hypothetical protein
MNFPEKIGPHFVGVVVALMGCGSSLGCLVFLVTRFGLLCSCLLILSWVLGVFLLVLLVVAGQF